MSHERKGCFNPVWSLIRVNIQISTNVSQVTWLRKTFEALEAIAAAVLRVQSYLELCRMEKEAMENEAEGFGQV
ncbi:hypothetical protein EJB05_27439, partial [Eragrostis curvula]